MSSMVITVVRKYMLFEKCAFKVCFYCDYPSGLEHTVLPGKMMLITLSMVGRKAITRKPKSRCLWVHQIGLSLAYRLRNFSVCICMPGLGAR